MLPCPLRLLKLKADQKLTTSNISMYDFFPPSYTHAQAICSSAFDSPNIIRGNMLNYQIPLSLACSIFRPSPPEVTFYFKEWRKVFNFRMLAP